MSIYAFCEEYRRLTGRPNAFHASDQAGCSSTPPYLWADELPDPDMGAGDMPLPIPSPVGPEGDADG